MEPEPVTFDDALAAIAKVVEQRNALLKQNKKMKSDLDFAQHMARRVDAELTRLTEEYVEVPTLLRACALVFERRLEGRL